MPMKPLRRHLALAYGPGGVAGLLEVARAREVMAQLEEKAIAVAEQRIIGVRIFRPIGVPLSAIREPQLKRFDPNRETWVLGQPIRQPLTVALLAGNDMTPLRSMATPLADRLRIPPLPVRKTLSDGRARH